MVNEKDKPVVYTAVGVAIAVLGICLINPIIVTFEMGAGLGMMLLGGMFIEKALKF
jgi:hypothetical protein